MKTSFVPVLPTRRSHEGTIFAGAADPCIGVACVQRQTDEHALPLDQVKGHSRSCFCSFVLLISCSYYIYNIIYFISLFDLFVG